MFLFEMAFTLLMLILLQAVLGFDNLLYISLESKKAPKEDRQRVRSLGIGIAIVLRIALLLILAAIIPYLQKPLFEIGQPIYPHPTAQHSDEGSPKTEKNHDPASKDQTGDAKTKDTKTDPVAKTGSPGKTADSHDTGHTSNRADKKTSNNWMDFGPSLHSIIVLFGGAFIIYTAIKEIFHMLKIEHDDHQEKESKSSNEVIFWIVLMNLIFSFDSILSAMALTNNTYVITAAIIASGIMMIYLADTVSNFLHRNRMYEVLGLFILFVVGIMLVTEGGHLAGLAFFGNAIVPMSKTTFYFVIAVLVLTDIVQSQYQKKLLAETDKMIAKHK